MAAFTHELLQARLQELHIELDADALHGALAGLVCAGISLADGEKIDDLATALAVDAETLHQHTEMLAALQAIIRQEIADTDLSFQLLLPDSDEFLSLRVQALARWAEGFVHGVVARTEPWSEDMRDVLEDIAQIGLLDDEGASEVLDLSSAALNDPAQANDNETDFIALNEFVRMAAIEIYRETVTPAADSIDADLPDSNAAAPAGKTLH